MKQAGLIGGCAALVLVANLALAQTLGDIAKQEAERRKTVKSGKVYTNDSVRPDPTSAAPPAPAAGAPAATATAEPKPAAPAAGAPAAQGGKDAAASPAPTPEEAKTEAYWRKRIAAVRDSLSRAQTFADALQTRINALSADFVNRDDPAQRNLIAADRQKAVDELARVKKEISDYQKTITDIQDEARRANVPPGWVR